MVKKENYVLIKTQADFERESNNFSRMSYERAKDARYALAPDFDVNIIWSKRQHIMFYPDYISRLIEGTLETMKKDEAAEFFNKIMISIRNREGYYFSPENLKKLLVNTDRNSVLLFLQAFYFSRDKFLKDKNDSGKFNKAVTPDNQVLFNIIGETAMGTLEYNFSGMPFEDIKMVESVLPREKDEWRMTANQKKLVEKFNHDFHVVDVKKLFPGAKDPQGLYDLHRGKVNPVYVMSSMDKDDYRFIRPSWDFKDLDPHTLYDFMSKRGLRWSSAQVNAFMNMIVDKAKPTREWLSDILKVINANEHIFLKQTEDNFKLWVKIESKFADVIKFEKEAVADIKEQLEKSRNDIEKLSKKHHVMMQRKEFIEKEYYLLGRLLDMASKLEVASNDGYFKKHAKNIEEYLNNFKYHGKNVQIEIPEKPWRLFAFEQEKKLYGNLVDLIINFNDFVKKSIDERIKLFGEYEFGLGNKNNETDKRMYELGNEISDFNYKIRTFENHKKIYEADLEVEKHITGQKQAKQERFDAAKKKMQEKGIVFGQKSGVVLVDKKIRDDKIKAKMDQMKKSGKYEDLTPEKMLEIAKKIVVAERK